jgi:hypothetical protein
MKKIIITIFILSFVLYYSTLAQEFKRVGTTGYGFLEIPGSARIAALGESIVALSTAPTDGLFINPAITGFAEKTHNFSLSYSNWLADTKHQSLSYVYHDASIGSIGLSVVYFDYGSMQQTENADPSRPGTYNILGTFSADALSFGLSYGKLLTDRFSLGINLKYVQEKIYEYKSSNYLIDAGFLYFTGFYTLRIAAAIQHFGTEGKYIGDAFRMPTTLRLGAAFEVFGETNSPSRLTVLAEAAHPSNYTERVNVGLEYWYNNLVALRGGYKFNYDEESFTAGIGIKSPFEPNVSFDISYQDFGKFDSIIRFTLLTNL